MDALERNGMAVNRDMITYGGLEEKDGVEALHKLLSRGRIPEAIFAVNDPVALGVYNEVRRMGLKIPRDVALIGFGDITLSSYLDPPLTTVAQSPYKIGKAAAGMLLRQIENPGRGTNSEVEVIETELIVRKSA
jgi:LacI family transcriptional regulator